MLHELELKEKEWLKRKVGYRIEGRRKIKAILRKSWKLKIKQEVITFIINSSDLVKIEEILKSSPESNYSNIFANASETFANIFKIFPKTSSTFAIISKTIFKTL